jgi:hypothetical protein
MNLTRKTTASVLKSLRNMVDDLKLISDEENGRIAANAIKIEKLNEANAAHRAERELADKVAANLNKLLGVE